jgi:hypothetical protein
VFLLSAWLLVGAALGVGCCGSSIGGSFGGVAPGSGVNIFLLSGTAGKKIKKDAFFLKNIS